MSLPVAPVFLVGTERSGTTMLRLMLNEHPQFCIPRETWFLIELMDELPVQGPLTAAQVERAVAITTSHSRWPDLEIGDEELRERIARLQSPTLAVFIDAIFAILLDRSGKPCWGDKTPGYVREIDRLHALFPQAKFVHIIRDARDVSLSLWGKRWFGPHLRNAAGRWSDCVRRGMESAGRLPQHLYTEVRYEDIVADPEKELARLCAFLGVPFNRSTLQFHQHAALNVTPWQRQHHENTLRPPSREDLAVWRHRAGFWQLVVIEAIAGKTMVSAGQKPALQGLRAAPVWLVRSMERLFVAAMRLRRRLLKSPSKRIDG